MKDLIIQLALAGFDYDSSENRFVRRGFMDVFVGVQIQDEGIAVSVCGVSDEQFDTIATFQTIEDTFEFIKNEGL